jgi:hypothetical protein
MDAPFSYPRGAPVQYGMQRNDGSAVLTRGVPVLRWASEKIRADKELVQFLVWSNPSNLHDASPALQADPDIVSTALLSPYYWEEHPTTSPALVLPSAAAELRAQRELVLVAVALNGYELEFAGERLRADPYVVAWAGAPKGAGASMLCGKEFARFVNTLPQSGVTVAHVEAHLDEVMDGYAKHIQNSSIGDNRQVSMPERWKHFRPEQKQQWCASVWTSVQWKIPLFFRVAPAVRAVLWPTVEGWQWAF